MILLRYHDPVGLHRLIAEVWGQININSSVWADVASGESTSHWPNTYSSGAEARDRRRSIDEPQLVLSLLR
jgi:hypothetical protein